MSRLAPVVGEVGTEALAVLVDGMGVPVIVDAPDVTADKLASAAGTDPVAEVDVGAKALPPLARGMTAGTGVTGAVCPASKAAKAPSSTELGAVEPPALFALGDCGGIEKIASMPVFAPLAA